LEQFSELALKRTFEQAEARQLMEQLIAGGVAPDAKEVMTLINVKGSCAFSRGKAWKE
jgi:hypothetical protein